MLERKDLELIRLIMKEELTHSGFATKDDLEGFATKDDLANFATKDDLANFATKDDLANFATKDDLANFATKDDLANFATKDDLANFATKDDLANFATKDDLAHSENLILRELDRVQTTLENRITQVEQDVKELHQYYDIVKLENDNSTLILKMVGDLTKRVEKLEERSA